MARDYLGYTPLLKAASLGRLEILDKLVSAGVPISHTDSFGNSALDKAKLYSRTNIINYINNKGQQFNKEKYDFWLNKGFNEEYNTGTWMLRQFYFNQLLLRFQTKLF